MFFRDKAEPRGHISRASELPAISGCGDQGGCGARANPGDGHEPTRAFVLLGEGFDLAGDLTQTLFEADQIFKEVGQKPTRCWRQVVELVRQCSREIRLELAGPLVEYDPILETERPHLIDKA